MFWKKFSSIAFWKALFSLNHCRFGFVRFLHKSWFIDFNKRRMRAFVRILLESSFYLNGLQLHTRLIHKFATAWTFRSSFFHNKIWTNLSLTMDFLNGWILAAIFQESYYNRFHFMFIIESWPKTENGLTST